MKIDNRIFVWPGAVSASIIIARAAYFLAGAPWTRDVAEGAALMSLLVGPFIAAAVYITEVDLGHTRIGGSK